MTRRRILVLGAGGRESALAWRLARDPDAPDVIASPGHPSQPGSRAFPDALHDGAAFARACVDERIDLVVVGPEAPLAAGVVDHLEEAGVPAFGPQGAAAQLESSKWFAKERMLEAGIATARGERFATLAAAVAGLDAFRPPYVLKADGLAAGKGVCIAPTVSEAKAFLSSCFTDRAFGSSGEQVVIEEHLAGEEASVMAVCDGTRHLLLPAARDYKRAYDGDDGPNTGGMGAYAPSGAVTPEIEREVSEQVVAPLLDVMRKRDTPFRGLLYAGLMLTERGPVVLEFNVRFGDPETQAILPLVSGSLGDLFLSAASGDLRTAAVGRAPGSALTVALVDEGYPVDVKKTGVIEGLDSLDPSRIIVFHAATRPAGRAWRVSGGRAAYVTATGETVEDARRTAFEAVGRLGGNGWRYREDIGRGAVAPARSTTPGGD